MNCPSCGNENPEGARFCMNCGSSLNAQPTPAADSSPSSTITIEFGKSSSANYTAAVQAAKQYPTYEEIGEGKDIRHKVTFDSESLSSAAELLDLVGRWKSTTFTIDGKLVSASKVWPGLSCYIERSKAFDPTEYCFGKDDAERYNDNDLGCRHCGINPYSWQGLKGFGSMTADGAFVVDKERLRHEVFRNLEDYVWCPALDQKKIEEKLKRIPDVIDPRKNRQWEYITEYEGGKEIAVAVRKKSRASEQGYVVKDGDKIHEHVIQIEAPKASSSSSGCLWAALLFLAAIILLIVTVSQ